MMIVQQAVIRSRSQGIESIINNIQTDRLFTKDVRDLSRISQQIYHPRSFNEVPTNIYQKLAERAELHRLAQVPGHFDLMKPQEIQQLPAEERTMYEENRCECGCKRVKGEPLPYCISEKQLRFMGSAVCLFLLMIRIALSLILIQFVVYGVFMLVADPLQNYEIIAECQQRRWAPCNQATLKLPLSLQMQRTLQIIELWLGVLACILQIIVLRLTKSFGRDIDNRIDQAIKTPSDGALLLENLPAKNNTQEEIEEFLTLKYKSKIRETHGSGKQAQQKLLEFKDKIKSIHVIYNLDEVRGFIEQIKEQSIKVSYFIEKGTGRLLTNIEQYKKEKQQLIKLLYKIQNFYTKFMQDREFRKSLSSQCCVVEFFSEKTKTQYEKQFGMERLGIFPRIFYQIKRKICGINNSQNYFKGNLILIQRAPEPQDMIWPNCQKEYRVWRILVIEFSILLLLSLGFGLMVLFEYIQMRLVEKDNSHNAIPVLNTTISVTVSLINYILSWTIASLMAIEFHHSYTDQAISIFKRSLVGSVFNSIFFPIISIYILRGNLFGPEGLTSKMLNFSITNCILPAVFSLFDLGYLSKRLALSIRCIRNKIMKYMLFSSVKNPESMMCIAAVNKFYENGDVNMISSYNFINLTLLHAAFFCSIEPLILPVSCISITLSYLIKKYLLLRRYTAPKKLHRLIFDNANLSISYMPLMFGLGAMFSLIAVGEKPAASTISTTIVPTAIIILVSFINLLNPKDLFDKISDKMYGFVKRGSKKLQERMESLRMKQFQREVEYYQVNTLSTLFGYKKIIHGQDIPYQVLKKVQQFVHNFGPHSKQFEYPSISSDNESVNHNKPPLNEDQEQPFKIGNSQL